MINLTNVLNSSARVQVHAHWDAMKDGTFKLYEDSPQNVELFDLSPAHPVKAYEASAFRAFLPPSDVTVGDVWELALDEVIPFLYQFHTGATGTLVHGQEGAFACLRAVSSDYADIAFRIHAEFTLESPAHREWAKANASDGWEPKARFIPSQFAGHVLINLKTEQVCAFSLSLPPRNSNVDINAFGCADMVFVPRMELIASDREARGEIAWDSAISEEAARKALALKFYRFAEIAWKSIEEAVALAKATNRPLHAVLVWGALDDESC